MSVQRAPPAAMWARIQLCVQVPQVQLGLGQYKSSSACRSHASPNPLREFGPKNWIRDAGSWPSSRSLFVEEGWCQIGEISAQIMTGRWRSTLSSIGVDGEAPVVRTYDDDGILTSAGLLTLTPDPNSGLINDATAGLVNTTYARNGYGERAVETHSWTGAGGSGAFGFTYGYDRESRLTQRVETRGVVTESLDYVHDARGRLVDVFVDSGAGGGATAQYHYDYDENNNRVGWNTPAGTCVPSVVAPCVDIDAQDRLLRHDDITFVYNERGQRISRSEPGGGGTLTTTYDYDEVGNLWRVVLPDATVVSYRVDGLGRRVARFVDGVAEAYWLYQDGLNPVAQLDGAGNVTQQYVYATRLNVPDLILTSGGATLRVLTDQVGSVRRVVDIATGATVLEREYSPYGVLEFSNGSFEQPFGYAGGLEDSLTGLVRFGARDYDPEIGRWTAKDPILTSGGVNLFEYGASAPQMFVDPNGLDAIVITYVGFEIDTDTESSGDSPLAHGAIVSVDPTTGSTRYYEYGRYGGPFGRVRRQRVPDLTMEDGILGRNPSMESVNNLLAFALREYGKDALFLQADYYSYADSDAVNAFAQSRMRDSNRAPYSILSNNCIIFAKSAALRGMPWWGFVGVGNITYPGLAQLFE